ncbi:MAG: DUF6166 domain-containing protein [Methylobacter sp.]|nr:DUF6166 domain-containing protein [Methylobacter sp.]
MSEEKDGLAQVPILAGDNLVWYRGIKLTEVGGQIVTRNGERLDHKVSVKLLNHSPDGFQWGYSGSGPAQLALALLLDATGDKNLALKYHQHFKNEYVAGWGERWEISRDEILEWVREW